MNNVINNREEIVKILTIANELSKLESEKHATQLVTAKELATEYLGLSEAKFRELVQGPWLSLPRLNTGNGRQLYLVGQVYEWLQQKALDDVNDMSVPDLLIV